jgi:hypothetical protein
LFRLSLVNIRRGPPGYKDGIGISCPGVGRSQNDERDHRAPDAAPLP